MRWIARDRAVRARDDAAADAAIGAGGGNKPLTPALSQREREKRALSLWERVG